MKINWIDIKNGKVANAICEKTKGKPFDTSISNPQELFNITRPLFEPDNDIEQFYIIFLNAKNKVIAIEKMFQGTITSALVYPREILKKVLSHKAVSVIACHNHPSGDPLPSNEDIQITKTLYLGLKLFNVVLLDHLIIGFDKYFSMQEHGYISRFDRDFSTIMNGD